MGATIMGRTMFGPIRGECQDSRPITARCSS